MSFLQFFCEIRLVVETMLKNIRCFIVFIVLLVLGLFHKQGQLHFHFSPLNMRLKRFNKLPFNAVKPNFVAIVWFQKISIPPPRRELEIPEGWGGECLDKFPEGQLHVRVKHTVFTRISAAALI